MLQTGSKAVSRLARLVLSPVPMRVCSGPNRGMRWIVGAGLLRCWLGTYESEKQRAIASLVRPGMTLYDVGAHSGFYTLLFSRLTGARGMVYSFEPCTYSLGFLLRHIKLNELSNVRVVQVALADAAGLRPMSVDYNSYQNRLCAEERTPLLVPTISLDAFEARPPHLIKIDVEGAEGKVLKGASRILSEAHPALFLALHGEEQRQKCAALLRAAGYGLYALDGTHIGGPILTDEIVALPRGSVSTWTLASRSRTSLNPHAPG
jgi:FkbM family methyltransferase